MSGSPIAGGKTRKLRIWLVEDNPDDQELAKLALARLDREVELRVSEDGAEAIEALRRLAGTGEAPPDLALVDVSMPRLDGPGLVAGMRQHPSLRRVPVVMFTTSTAKRDIDASYAAGCNAYVVKPYSLTGLVEMLQCMISFWGMVAPWE